MRIVLDTNVVVSAFLSPHGTPAQVVRLALRGDLVPLYDERIGAEYRNVLARPKLGFDPADVADVVGQLERVGELVLVQSLPVELPDPDDLPFLEVAAAGGADALVTGNPRHFHPRRGELAIVIASPRQLMARLA